VGRVYQEFCCQWCKGFITLSLNERLNGFVVRIHCPKCNNWHDRSLVNGQLEEAGRERGHREELYPTIAAWSDAPLSQRMKIYQDLREHAPSRRVLPRRPGDAAVLRSIADLNAEAEAEADKESRRQMWLDRFSGRLVGDVDS